MGYTGAVFRGETLAKTSNSKHLSLAQVRIFDFRNSAPIRRGKSFAPEPIRGGMFLSSGEALRLYNSTPSILWGARSLVGREPRLIFYNS